MAASRAPLRGSDAFLPFYRGFDKGFKSLPLSFDAFKGLIFGCYALSSKL